MQPLGSGGASSSAFMLPPPAPPSDRIRGAAPPSPADSIRSATSMGSQLGDRGGPKVIYVLPNGSNVTFYAKGKRFVGECKERGHGRCFCTRYATPSKVVFGKGNPLGLIFAFCLLDDPTVGNHEHVHMFFPAHAQRQVARTHFWNMRDSSPVLAGLFKNELNQHDGATEPLCMP